MFAGIKNERPYFLLAKIFFVTFMVSINCSAEIYKGEDKSGHVYFGDKLPKTDMKIEKVNQGVVTSTIQGEPEDALRNKEQAQRWYKERLKQSKKEDKLLEIEKAKRIKENKKRQKVCERAKKYFNDKKADLHARKRAGIKPKKEKQFEINIKQLKRDVDYYC